jgi:hypothetical protein
MSRLNIDLRSDPEIPAGRELMEHLVGAHMVAQDEEELLHLVRHSIDVLHSTSSENSIRVLTHAAYRGQALIIRLLDLAASQQIQLENAGVGYQPPPTQDSDRCREQRLDLWTSLREDQD